MSNGDDISPNRPTDKPTTPKIIKEDWKRPPTTRELPKPAPPKTEPPPPKKK